MEIDPTELNVAIAEAKAAGRLTERLAVLGMQVARGYLRSEKFNGYPAVDLEDIFGAWTLRFVKSWRRLDPEGNPHAYITTMVANSWRMHERSAQRRIRRESAKADAVYHEEMDRCARFIRSYGSDENDVLTVREYTRKITGRGDSA